LSTLQFFELVQEISLRGRLHAVFELLVLTLAFFYLARYWIMIMLPVMVAVVRMIRAIDFSLFIFYLVVFVVDNY